VFVLKPFKRIAREYEIDFPDAKTTVPPSSKSVLIESSSHIAEAGPVASTDNAKTTDGVVRMPLQTLPARTPS
jgi:hypothetical protein